MYKTLLFLLRFFIFFFSCVVIKVLHPSPVLPISLRLFIVVIFFFFFVNTYHIIAELPLYSDCLQILKSLLYPRVMHTVLVIIIFLSLFLDYACPIKKILVVLLYFIFIKLKNSKRLKIGLLVDCFPHPHPSPSIDVCFPLQD